MVVPFLEKACKARIYCKNTGLYTSDQSQTLEADMPILADDDVIMHGDAEWLGGIDDRLGHVDISAGRGRVAAWVVVDEDDRGG